MLEELKYVFKYFNWRIFISACFVGLCIIMFGIGALIMALYETLWPVLLWIVSAICMAIALAIV